MSVYNKNLSVSRYRIPFEDCLNSILVLTLNRMLTRGKAVHLTSVAQRNALSVLDIFNLNNAHRGAIFKFCLNFLECHILHSFTSAFLTAKTGQNRSHTADPE